MSIKHIPNLTVAMLNQLKSSKGGYTRATMKTLGVDWPPKHGWRKELMRMARENEARQQAIDAGLLPAQTNEAVKPSELPKSPIGDHLATIKHRLLLLTQEARAHAFRELETIYCLKCGKMRTDDWPCCIQ